MEQDLAQTAQTSRDPMELMEAAERAARSADPADHAELRKHLLGEAFLARLDSDEDYRGTARELLLARVLLGLSENRCAPADETLSALCADPMFGSVELRQELLIRLCVPVRPPTPAILAFWTRHLAPDQPYKHVASDCVADNGTHPAVALLETELTNPAQDEQDRVAWMRDAILRNRDNPVVLEASERLVKKGLPDHLRPPLVAALFDYRETWYLACDPPEPPEWPLLRAEAKTVLVRIGEHALEHAGLDEATRAVVEARIEALGGLAKEG
jgi:hypothetical protein